MKRLTRLFSLAFIINLLLLNLVFAVDFPKATGFVNDYANILSASEKANIEQILKGFETETSNQVVVAIVDSLQGLDRFTYSQQLFTAWAIGQKNRNNGILFLIGPKEGAPFPAQGEAFINVGNGLGGALPDSLTGTILRNEVFPLFKAGKMSDGILAGVNAIMSATKGEYKPDPNATSKNPGGMGDGLASLLFFGGFALINYFFSFLARSKSWWLGGVLGGVGGGAAGALIYGGGMMILIGVVFFAVFGSLLDLVLSKNYEKRKLAGKPTDFWHSGGGFWLGGGGSGGGGFGGFGGGGSGGGGAGGSW
ncbi:MAG: TPM domain-containing protein [Candidatus Gracilibacteria bacterium]